MTRARVLIADDNDVYRRLLARFISAHDDLQVVGEASDGLLAVAMCSTLDPDVVVMDLRMPGVDGFEAMRRLSVVSPRARVIAISAHRCETDASECLAAGAQAFLPKSRADVGLIALIRELAASTAAGPLGTKALSEPSSAPAQGS